MSGTCFRRKSKISYSVKKRKKQKQMWTLFVFKIKLLSCSYHNDRLFLSWSGMFNLYRKHALLCRMCCGCTGFQRIRSEVSMSSHALSCTNWAAKEWKIWRLLFPRYSFLRTGIGKGRMKPQVATLCSPVWHLLTVWPWKTELTSLSPEPYL